jgi:5-methylcytosine-specific restriction protein A
MSPSASRQPCIVTGCSALIEPGKVRCVRHEAERRASQREPRVRARADEPELQTWKIYNSGRWKLLRSLFRASHPLCAACLAEGKGPVPADEVDHVIPITQAPDRIWDLSNLQSLCSSHHSQKTRRETRATT